MEDTHYSYMSMYILQILSLEESRQISTSEISWWPEACIVNAVCYKISKKKNYSDISVSEYDNTGHTRQTLNQEESWPLRDR